MTNTLNTPAEALEYAYPLRITRYALRRGSGGEGARRGGDGLVREIELLADAQVTILSERRAPCAVGAGRRRDGRMRGESACRRGGRGGAATEGAATEGRPDYGVGDRRAGGDRGGSPLPGKTTFAARAGDRIIIATPGGGGHGAPEDGAVFDASVLGFQPQADMGNLLKQVAVPRSQEGFMASIPFSAARTAAATPARCSRRSRAAASRALSTTRRPVATSQAAAAGSICHWSSTRPTASSRR